MQLGTLLGDHERFTVYLVAITFVGCYHVARGVEARRWLSVIAVFAAAYLLDGTIVGWLKHGLDLPRPPAALPPDSVHVVGTAEFRRSFPSGHALFAMTLVASVWPLLNRPWRIAAAVFVAWVALSRMYLGMHFP